MNCLIEFDDDDDNEISVGGFAVWDSSAAIVRFASIGLRACEKWISMYGDRYADDDEDDDLS